MICYIFTKQSNTHFENRKEGAKRRAVLSHQGPRAMTGGYMSVHFGPLAVKNGSAWAQFGYVLAHFGNVLAYFWTQKNLKNRIFTSINVNF